MRKRCNLALDRLNGSHVDFDLYFLENLSLINGLLLVFTDSGSLTDGTASQSGVDVAGGPRMVAVARPQSCAQSQVSALFAGVGMHAGGAFPGGFGNG